jgi:hypothetical protein
VNSKIKLSNSKVVDVLDIENITENVAFCRCWKTKNVCRVYILYNMHNLICLHTHKHTHTQFFCSIFILFILAVCIKKA